MLSAMVVCSMLVSAGLGSDCHAVTSRVAGFTTSNGERAIVAVEKTAKDFAEFSANLTNEGLTVLQAPYARTIIAIGKSTGSEVWDTVVAGFESVKPWISLVDSTCHVVSTVDYLRAKLATSLPPSTEHKLAEGLHNLLVLLPSAYASYERSFSSPFNPGLCK